MYSKKNTNSKESKLFLYLLLLYNIHFNAIIIITQDILLKPETSEISYPLLNIYVLHKIFTNSNSNKQIVTIESICVTDVIVSNEYKTFLSSLEMNGM